MSIWKRIAILGAFALTVVAGLTYSASAPRVQAALGGPVIIGGDDLTDHGCYGEGGNVLGWLYMQRALENIEPNVLRSNDGTIAALGSADVGGEVICYDAGSAIYWAADAAGMTVDYYDGGGNIREFFAALESGDAEPAIIWIAGTGASNNIDDEDEAAALTENAQAISDFVGQGGGLLSHGTEYGWLFALLPDATDVSGGCDECEDLYFTPDGLSELPSLTDGDINAGPWHNHFEGDFGGLKVLVRSSEIDDSTDQDAAVILGGAQVTFEENPEEPAPEPQPEATATPCIPPLIGYRCDTKSGGSQPQPTEAPAESPTQVVSVLPATVAPQPTPRSGVVVSAPDTGDGSGTGGTGSAIPALIAMAIAGVAALAGGMTLARRRA